MPAESGMPGRARLGVDGVAGAAQAHDPEAASAGFDMVREVPLELRVELGRVRVPVAQVLELTEGTVIELDRLAGEPLDVLLDGRCIARAEMVVLGERMGVRVIEILAPDRPADPAAP